MPRRPPVDERVPSVSDKRWKRLSYPVLDYLIEPRDWAHLDAWVRAHRFGAGRFRQVLAWLEEQGLAVSFIRDETVYWVEARWLAKISEIPPKP